MNGDTTEPAEKPATLAEQINQSIRNAVDGVMPSRPQPNRATRRKEARKARTTNRARDRDQLLAAFAAANRKQ